MNGIHLKYFYNELKSYFTLPFTMTIVDNIHYVDDKVLGYRGGYFFWLGLYIVNITILSVDSTTGHQREYLTNTSLMGCLSLVYYSYNQFKGNPSSVPGQHAAGTEALARLLYAAHCGWGNIIGSNPMGVWNFVLLIIATMFAATKLVENTHTIWNRNVYLEYVERQKEVGIR